jgi:exopolysaccharide biosynthesis polyprenyl glycosylphosphotransferase
MIRIFQPTVSQARSVQINGVPAIKYSSVPEQSVAVRLKGILDRIGSFFGILLISPILAVVSLLIKLDSKGPVLFKQTRTGKNGRVFELWKFRTMIVEAENQKKELEKFNEMSGPVFKIANDPRVTGIGRILRKYSIDELPQLFNVLRGDMSLVGPRPPLPSESAQFEPWQYRKLSVKPGLTCLWQTNGRNNIDFDEWMKLDLKYIDNWSLWEDAKIIARTIPTVLKGTGT